jgi:hypothetical protein
MNKTYETLHNDWQKVSEASVLDGIDEYFHEHFFHLQLTTSSHRLNGSTNVNIFTDFCYEYSLIEPLITEGLSFP